MITDEKNGGDKGSEIELVSLQLEGEGEKDRDSENKDSKKVSSKPGGGCPRSLRMM